MPIVVGLMREMITRMVPTIQEIQRDGVETPAQIQRLTSEALGIMRSVGMSEGMAQAVLGPLAQELTEEARRAGKLAVDASSTPGAGSGASTQEGATSSAQE